MKVVILAAGRSFRLKPIEDKNFLKFLGKPLIQHQLEMLLQAGFDDFILIGGEHNLAQLQALSGEVQGANIQVVEQKKLDDGMAGAVLAAQTLIKGNEEMLIVSSNDMVEIDAYNLIKTAAEDFSLQGAMIGKKVSEYFPGGYLQINEEEMILQVVEKPTPGTEPSDMINLVIHYYREPQKLFAILEEINSDKDDHYEVALSTYISQGAHIKAVPYEGKWQAIKYPWHIQRVFEMLMERAEAWVHESVQIADSAKIKGKVIIEAGTKILDNAVVQGPAYLGKNCIVANNALVRDSNLGDRCVAGYTTEIARSFLGDDVWTHSNYIGDSVIGNNVSFGAGCVTGNLRLDENNIQVEIKGEKIDCGSAKFGLVTGNQVRAGINTSFMPGVKIGNNCFIGAGIVVAEDIPDGKYVYAKTELTIKDNKYQPNAQSRANFMQQLAKKADE